MKKNSMLTSSKRARSRANIMKISICDVRVSAHGQRSVRSLPKVHYENILIGWLADSKSK